LSFVTKLQCAKCGKNYAPEDNALFCKNHDDGRLDIFYDYDAIRNEVSREGLSKSGDRLEIQRVFAHR